MEDFNNLENIDDKIRKLKMEKKKIKQAQDRNLRLRSNNSGKSNIARRVSINFGKEQDIINKTREENGLDCLSYPKITELIVQHKKGWKIIKSDIIGYNTLLDTGEEEFSDK